MQAKEALEGLKGCCVLVFLKEFSDPGVKLSLKMGLKIDLGGVPEESIEELFDKFQAKLRAPMKPCYICTPPGQESADGCGELNTSGW